MTNFFFSAKGRIGRAGFWKGIALLIVVIILTTILSTFLGLEFTSTDDGNLRISFATGRSIPASLLFAVVSIAVTWAGVCLGIKRFHDRDKPGVWVLIQFVPFIGAVWYLVEAGFLAGTPGPNKFGPARHAMLPAGIMPALD